MSHHDSAVPITNNGLFVGQRVRCIDPDLNELTKGMMYMVFKIHQYCGDWFVKLRADDGIDRSYCASRFEPWFKPDAPTTPPGNPSNGDTTMLVKMTFITDHKINLIKEMRTLTGSGLREAKDAVEGGIIFNLLNFNEVKQFAKVVDMIDQTYTYHQAAYTLENYVRPIRPADPVDSLVLFQRATI